MFRFLRPGRLVVPALVAALSAPPVAAAGRRGPPPIVEDALAYAATDRGRAADLLDAAAVDASPRSRPTIVLYAGEQRRLLGETRAARERFAQVLAAPARHANHDAAALGLALLDAAEGASPEVVSRLRRLSEDAALPTQNADRYLVLAIVAAAAGDEAGLEEARRKALGYAAQAPDVFERVEARLDRLTATEAPSDTPIVLDAGDLTDLELAERALARGDRERVLALVEQIRAGDPTEAEARAADYLVRRLDAAPVRPGRIGVLLPLSGRYAAVGERVRQALEYGWRLEGGVGHLEIVDAGTTPEEAVAALERLVLEDGVVAVAGPLLSDQGEAVAAAAEALRVPLLGLAQSMEPGDGQDWVVRGVVSVADQVDALVAYAMDEAGMSTFAIFAPDNGYGHTAAEAFSAAVQERGGAIAVTQFYDPESNDMTEAARLLGRKDYEARRAELLRLRRETEARGGDPSRVVLPPTLDFDGLFIPDNASRVPLACAALAFEEFPVGEFRTTRDGPTIPLLGLNGWNHPDLLTQGGPYVRGSLFTELFVADDPDAVAFEERFRSDLGRTPSPLEAVVVDAGRLLAAASRSGGADRPDFRDALLSAAPEASATGLDGVDPETRAARHDIRILTITRDAIEAVDRPHPAGDGASAP